MSMINGTEFEVELVAMRSDFEDMSTTAKKEFPVMSTFDYLGVLMCVTGIDLKKPRHVQAFTLSQATEMILQGNYENIFEIPDVRGAHNVEGEIIINCEYLNSATGLFMSKSFNIHQLREIYQLNSIDQMNRS